ncbi:MAG: FAD-dependent oxidoreductase [Synechococcaceae bacterium WBA_2_066]|nr:FAD-dependent oxidoreductase [Synechococcaceae bacterium WB5_2A_257]NBY59131.1 FAD-dependent oxidoreductase [Synechococcaceae bacterium LLD_019]NCU75399.1 FAD-dependent oxidoreductase [Synechococcaceae bacterium WB7_1C_051]NDC06554.1 FAD-dependent oxidoreductase [Synechococcaceae bacterium WB9_2_069]NDE37824.1 FAD-dependent oxidoreductase [Synechococcaceae bacterium WBA_2_066]
MIRIHQLALSLNHSADDLLAAVARRLKLSVGELGPLIIKKRSIDARDKQAIELVYSVDVEVASEAAVLGRLRGNSQLGVAPEPLIRPSLPAPAGFQSRPVVIGAGPCGYFAALFLAQQGFKPLLLERGRSVNNRTADTFGFWKGNSPFNPRSNAQFGEGGAGTFSDGKLYSGVKESKKHGRWVLEEFVESGANPEILVLQKPHIGTFKLVGVVRKLRARIEALGGEVRFEQQVVGFDLDPDTRQLRGLQLSNSEIIPTTAAVLAIGHSARDTFAQLHLQGVEMQAKPFSVGFRIEHPQELIDRARWGDFAGHPILGAADYKLVHHASNGRSVYSFCMCPGGLVVGATSEEGHVVTNGMSQYSRNERNANSGIVVGISPELDYPNGVLAGVAFQRQLEARAYFLGGKNYNAPAQRLEDFLLGQPSIDLGPLQPSYAPGVTPTDLSTALPTQLIEAIREALPAFAKQIPGFDYGDALLTGVETRTSSPVRISRGDNFQSVNTPGLFPAGEGAGYAGGILSAGIDGLRVGEAVAKQLLAPANTLIN